MKKQISKRHWWGMRIPSPCMESNIFIASDPPTSPNLQIPRPLLVQSPAGGLTLNYTIKNRLSKPQTLRWWECQTRKALLPGSETRFPSRVGGGIRGCFAGAESAPHTRLPPGSWLTTNGVFVTSKKAQATAVKTCWRAQQQTCALRARERERET